MPARSTAFVRSAVLFGIDHVRPLCFLGKLASQWKQRADAAVAQGEAQPKQNPETELDEIRVADAQVRGDGAAHVAGQKHSAEYRRARNQIKNRANELNDAEGQNDAFVIAESREPHHE